MVTYGFSLLELRRLYIDELYYFYNELFYTLEMKGEVKIGTYDKLKVRSSENTAKDTVNLLRKQMFKSIANKKKSNGR